MKPIEDLPVNEWNYQVPVVDASAGIYLHRLMPDSGRQDIPSEAASNSATTEDAGSPAEEGRE